mgnify:CR=1 FL=1
MHFPQLEGVEVPGPFPCRFCEVEKPTLVARDQHEGVAHKDRQGNILTGEVLAEAIVKGLNARPPVAAGTSDQANLLAALAAVGLNKKQREVLEALGIALPKKNANDDAA